MSTSVDNHIRNLSHQPTNKQGQAKIAASQRLVGKSAVRADVIVSAAGTGKQVIESPTPVERLSLPRPLEATKMYQGGSDDDENLLALIGGILLLQAQSDSNTWRTMWKMATMSMQMQIELAPLAGKAIQTQFLAQSTATLVESQLSYANGQAIGFGAFGALGHTGYEKGSDAYKKYQAQKAVEYGNETNVNANSPSALPAEEKSPWDFGKAWDWVADKAPTVGKWAYETVDEGADKAHEASGVTKIMVDTTSAIGHAQQQSFQGMQGQAASISQSSQVFASFYGQNFSKMDELRQSAGQNLMSAMNLLQQATNTISQSAVSMFRG